MRGRRLLLVEDEEGLILTIGDRLRAEGFDVEIHRDGDAGFQAARERAYDLVLLDLMLPKRSGFDVCRDLRQEGVTTPILMLTARDQLVDKVLGLKLGADDYLTKPFETAELLARIEAILRRSGGDCRLTQGYYRFDTVSVDLRRAQVLREGLEVSLSAKEFALLSYFLRNPEAALTRDELLDRVWGYEAEISTRTVDVHIAALRKKLEPDPRHPRFLQTVHGIGYRFSMGTDF